MVRVNNHVVNNNLALRPLYGVQFHRERYTLDNSAGDRVIGNFVRLWR